MARTVGLFVAAFLLCTGLLILVPAIDLGVSGWFYRPGDGFFLADRAPLRIVHAGARYLVGATILMLLAILIAAAMKRGPVFGIGPRAAIFLLLSLALGPGLVVNSLFKDHWGRARPVQVTAFGGDKQFTPAFVPSDQCYRNCSFPAGDPSVGFFFVSAALLVADRPRRRLAMTGALLLGALFGIVRLAQGGHFLSDVVTSGFLTVAIGWALWRWIFVHDGLASLRRSLRAPPPGLRRFAILAVPIAAIGVLSYAVLDRPLALFFQANSPTVDRVFQFVTTFGVSTGWLVATAVIGLLCWGAAGFVGDRTIAQRLRMLAAEAAFIFAAVALSGLIADLVKPMFGRLRPKLYVANRLFGFTGNGAHADHWSFPSGHAVTATALALALSFLYPRGWPIYWAAALLIAASRVVIDAHYLSDVIGGAFLGIAVTWALWSSLHAQGYGPRP